MFNDRNARTQLSIAGDSQHEAALQDYIDDMSALLLDQELRTVAANAEPRTIARPRTLSVLRALDAGRRRTVLEFLQETQLISATTPILRLDFANLSGVDLLYVDLSGTDLSRVNLSGALLSDARFSGTDLASADLRDANLSSADLSSANLSGADVSGANLSGANLTAAKVSGTNFTNASLTDAQITDQQLAQAGPLTGATLPDGSKHE